ncbi:TetR/AcrR family transcriptional regulator [Mycobacterium paraseoulense]|uniref:TetR family transcriptional regulator n=1 Tax=Mycobacterium paraseoulense TaxID=590652 RepID=A0A1X0IBL8_9MYCO|nr:TetR/AcrR family transcriptional regulator [Mycobacterium paraseoulense]MCV7397963.1 helix-turn-helix transcriptional regulator [Mycobacterium paraseoulense]ORB41035.1 TetR family transcriptional regulator [Mycobacterium paraseoulense]BBZ70300.1 TetR family transcriptional regulator [Mycobacterium paraseoulense]
MAKPVAARGFARERVLEAALELFAQYGVRGTSIQMIGARLGVTKASVYYQFQSKDDIALAVAQPIFDDLARIQRIANGLPTPEARRDVALSGLIDLVIRHRQVANVIYGDPAMTELINTHPDLRHTVDNFTDLLLGAQRSCSDLVAMTLLTAGIYGCTADARLSGITDDDLRDLLQDVVKKVTAAL